MSLLQQINADLTLLSTESKRKFASIRRASERSLDILKSLTAHTSSAESAVFESLQNLPEFIDPFLLSCHSKSPKFISTSLSALSKLVLRHGIPFIKLDEVIRALQDATHSSTDIQLKILQILPTLFESYAMDINDESLSNLLYICTLLQNSTKTPAIVSTAQATFSQLMSTVFEKVNEEGRLIEQGKIVGAPRYTVPVDDDKTIKVHLCAYDAQRVFSDLCTLIEHHKPSFLKTNYMTEDDGFEILESIIKNNREVFLHHIELGYLLRIRVAPILLRFISSCDDFTLMVRVSRLAFLLISEVLDITKIESEVTLSLLTHLLSKESRTPVWKKIFCLEIYVSIMKDFSLVETIFNEYDNNKEEERRTVLKDFIEVCYTIADESRSKLNTGDLIQQPPSQINAMQTDSPANAKASTADHGPSVFSLSDASIKQRYMDSIDRPDPPDAPENYLLCLVANCIILLSDGVCQRSLELAKQKNDATYISFLDDSAFHEDSNLYLEYRTVRSLTEDIWQKMLSIFEIFLFSTLDDDTFSRMTRSLQKLCHASGVLSVTESQDKIIFFFATSTVRLTGKSSYQNKTFSLGESIAGTISSAIGQAVSNISHTTRPRSEVNNTPPTIQLYTRNLNSRQTTCFRVLLNLAVSLGEVLHDSWRPVFIVLQWVSYFIDGPSGLSTKDIPPISPLLSNDELSVISNSLDKFAAGLKTQSPDVFLTICRSLIELSDSIIPVTTSPDDSFGRVPISDTGALEPCLYNRSFYLNKLADICEVNPLKFLALQDDCWECVRNFYTRLSGERSLDDETRLLLSRNFDTIVKAVSIAGFADDVGSTDSERDEIHLITEHKVLNALSSYLTRLSKLPAPHELLIMNIEIQMVLQTLDTLKTIIDRFGNKIRRDWEVVTSMLNFPFGVIKRGDSSIMEEKSTTEMIISLLRSSFETLKVILDEMLQSIPSNQIRIIIDSLYNFVSQQYELNISFNSSSYFWLISDYLKERLDSLPKSNSPSLIEHTITSRDKLVEAVTSELSPNTSADYYRCLWLYLLFNLANTTSDSRAQVRNGSIITFFNVVDSYADENPSWLLIYRIVLGPVILQILPREGISSSSRPVQKDWIETLINVVNGLTKMFSQYLSDFPEAETANMIDFWHGYIFYMGTLVNLDPSWISLSAKVFENFDSMIRVFSESDKNLPMETIEEFYTFWVNVKIVYNLADDNSYEDSLRSFASSFTPLYGLLTRNHNFTVAKLEKMLMQLNTCIRFPVLIANRNDEEKCTNLQNEILNDLEPLTFSDARYDSILIQQLNSIVTLPFSTRDLVESKLSSKGVKIPTFKAASYRAINLLMTHLDSIDDPSPYLNDRSLIKVYDALLEPCRLKNDPRTRSSSHRPLWMESLDILLELSYKICDYIIAKGKESEIKQEVEVQIWPRVLELFKTCFITSNDEGSETFDLKTYKDLKKKIVELVSIVGMKNLSEPIINEFVKTIWESSFLYQLDDIDKEIMSYSSSPLELVKHISDYRASNTFGSTLSIIPVPRIKIAKACLEDLIVLSLPCGGPLSDITLNYFAARCSFALDKYLSDECLLNRKPVPRIQQSEMRIILDGLFRILVELNNCDAQTYKRVCDKLTPLYPVLVSMVSSSTKANALNASLTSIFGQLGRLKNSALNAL
ncbi:DEKNAAC102472 [Brettanomyces naardenensis]|uniref:DEKNAAC102472 n=1 Tax=Brettanomyces naardenensis TaxID=13370 RepID=A0A448YKR7_BRENA|nr:DEKNAAC102472 [Brettanomyces naardenensis]